jgi:serine protein kinase
MSPVFESPLGLFPGQVRGNAGKRIRHSRRYLTGLMSPWAVKRLEGGGDIRKFSVAKV